MTPDSTRQVRPRKTASDRPRKPYPLFPLYAHPSGNWAKKIRGKFHYFGRWGHIRKGAMERIEDDGWVKALELYNAQKDDLHKGRKPRAVKNGELTVKDLCNRFLTAKLRKVESRELSPRSLAEYRYTTDRLIAFFGKGRMVEDLGADDFEELRADIAKTCGPVRLGNEITRVKSVLKYAADNRLIDGAVNFGSEFRKPGKAVMRKHRAEGGKKLFTAKELHTLLEAASPQLKAVVLLGINAGAGNSDVANLQLSHLDLKGGWLDYAHGKTGIGRRVPLWKETVIALKSAIADRSKPKDKADVDCVFLTPRRDGDVRSGGTRLVHTGEKSRTDYVAREFGRLLRELKINGRRGLGFYSLRHTFATIGLQTGDRDAVKSLMGHAEGDVLSLYDESGPSDERLRAVTDHVHGWLFGEGGAK